MTKRNTIGTALGRHVRPPNQTPIRAPRPSTAYTDPSVLAGLGASSCRRLISRDYSPHELISLMEDIFTSEVKIVGDLGKDAAQVFVDVVHGVCSIVLHLCGTT